MTDAKRAFTLDDLAARVKERASASADMSYTRKLLDKGLAHCAKKLGEEAVETALAAVGDDREHLIAETADLLYHLMVVLEARGIALSEVEAELARIGHTLAPLEIVLVNTAAGAAYGRPDYVARGCGMGREATLWLLERGVRVTGTDGWSWDAPFVHTRERWLATHDPALIWEGHKAGREIGYCHLEKLCNLEQLPPTGFTVSCLPVKIRGASAGWTRAVAILD